MRRLLLLLPIALLVPASAWADSGPGLASLTVTVVYYSRFGLFLLGALAVFRAVIALLNGRKWERHIFVAFAAAIGATALAEVLRHFGITAADMSAANIASSGRSAGEFLEEQIGLMQASMIATTAWFKAIVFALLMFLLWLNLSGVEIGDGNMEVADSTFGSKMLTLSVVFLVFSPIWTSTDSARNNAQQVVQDILAHQAAAKRAASDVKMPGPIAAPPSLNSYEKTYNGNQVLVAGSTGGEPKILAWLNQVLDQVVATTVATITGPGFQAYGMAQLEGMKQDLQSTVPNWLVPDLRRRVMFFIDTCTTSTLYGRQAKDPEFAHNFSADPTTAAALYDPFSKSNLTWYNKHDGRECAMMLAGGYNFSPSGAITQGTQYPYGLEDEILASMAVNDPRIRGDFPDIKTLGDAAQHIVEIKAKYTNWKANVRAIFLNAIRSYAAMSNGQAGQLQNQWQNVNGIVGAGESAVSGIGAEAHQLFSNVTGSFSASQVTVSMPIMMAEAGNMLLLVYPFVWLGALVGGPKVLGGYFATLASTKAYVIPWAIVSNNISAKASFELGQSYAHQLAFIHTQQEFLRDAPFIVLFVISTITGFSMYKMKGGMA